MGAVAASEKVTGRAELETTVVVDVDVEESSGGNFEPIAENYAVASERIQPQYLCQMAVVPVVGREKVYVAPCGLGNTGYRNTEQPANKQKVTTI